MQPITQTQLQAEAEAHFEMVLKEVIDTALAAIMHHIDELRDDEIDISRKLKIEVCYPTKLAVDLSWDDLVGVFKPYYFSRNQQVDRSVMVEKYNWLIFAYFGLLLFHHSRESYRLKNLVQLLFTLIDTDTNTKRTLDMATLTDIAHQLTAADSANWRNDLGGRVANLYAKLQGRFVENRSGLAG